MFGSRWLVVIGLLFMPFYGFGGTLAQFRTVFGDIEVELYDQDKPVTVQNFVRYAQEGAYQDEFAHRLLPGFVLQGGGFTVSARGTTNWQISAVATYPPITNEFGVGRRFSNVYGTIAMAKVGGDTNSATSQWFFNLADNTFLDNPDTNNLFVVFGHVISGTNVLNVFNKFQLYDGTQTNNLVAYVPPYFNDLPLLKPVLSDTNFLFVDVSLLQVAISTNPDGGHVISWNSAAAMTNVVEFTTSLPPTWTELVRTNGTGNRISVNDNTSAGFRFYRVRVE